LSEEEKERMAREAEKLVKRTIEKTSYSHSNVPGYVNDFLTELESFLKKLNYKAILRAAIKKTVMSQDREHSWKRPNKRYGTFAPGTSLSHVPRINMYIDTSGSISHLELNEFLDVIDNFLKAGSKECKLVLWHTQPYYNKKYKLKQRVKVQDLQSGGTDPNPTLELIKKSNPDLSIILTDGFYDKTDVKVTSDLIWIISKTGNKDHLNKHLGKTIPLESIK
jgi:predicted metal-dependent peptidase